MNLKKPQKKRKKTEAQKKWISQRIFNAPEKTTKRKKNGKNWENFGSVSLKSLDFNEPEKNQKKGKKN